MQHHATLIEFKELLAKLCHEIETSVAMEHLDIAHVSEYLSCELFRILFEWHDLRNMNAEERRNYPSIDLASDSHRLAVQITATANIHKVKDTLHGFLRHGFDRRYDRLIVYVLTRRQRKYSQNTLKEVTKQRIDFDVDRDILDYRSVAQRASQVSPQRLTAAVRVLRQYMCTATGDASHEDLDPPSESSETLTSNLVPVAFPPTLYIADLLPDTGATTRKGLRAALAVHGLKAPSDYEVHSRQIITFRNLHAHDHAFVSVVDTGTVTPVSPPEFYAVSHDHENTFKSLLRLLLQQRLYKHRVIWKHEDNLFVFYPHDDADDLRRVQWSPGGGSLLKVRKVFERRMSTADPTKVSFVKHLAFSPQFLRVQGKWYLAITPDWFFSYGAAFRRSNFADDKLSRVKRMEKESSVRNHFRFWAWWLAQCDKVDMFAVVGDPVLKYDNPFGLVGATRLDEGDWEVIGETGSDEVSAGSGPLLEGL